MIKYIPILNIIIALAATSNIVAMAGTPLLEAVHEIQSPTHQVPQNYGWSNYDGEVYVNENYIIIYNQYDEEADLISGAITVMDRWSFEELGTVRPDFPENLSGWGKNIALIGHRLAVSAGTKSNNIHVYDLSTTELPKLYSINGSYNVSSMKGLNTPDPLWLTSTTTQTTAYRMSDGSYCGSWSMPMGSQLAPKSAWILSTVSSQQWNGIDQYFLANLTESSAIIDLRTLPEIESGYDEFYAWQRGEFILILTSYSGDESAYWKNFYAYDPASGSIIWQKQQIEGWWYDPAVVDGRLFVENNADGLDVYDLESGSSLDTLEPPVSNTLMFGHAISGAKGLLFISAINQLFVYDSDRMEFLYELDIQGHVDLDSGFAQEVAGIKEVVFLYNLFNPPPNTSLYNSSYRNPQAMLFDVETGQLTRQLNLSQAVIVGYETDLDPRNFPISVFDAERGCLGIWSGFDFKDSSYQVFDPSLSSEGRSCGVVAAVSFEEQPGVSYELSRQAGNNSELLTKVEFGEDKIHSIDVPLSHRNNGTIYSLHEQEIVHVVDEYEQPFSPLDQIVTNSLSVDSVNRYYAVAPDAGSVAVSDVAQSGYPTTSYSGKVTVVDLATGLKRFSLLPETSQAGKGFGSRVALSDHYLAVGDVRESAVSVYDLQNGALVKLFGGGETFAIGQDCLVRLVKSGSDSFLLTCHDLPSGQVRFSVPANYDPLYDWIVPDLNISGDYVVFELQVFDLATGAYRYTLTSPAPEPDDYFGTRVAGNDGKFVAISALQATGYLFDLASGTHERTFLLPEWPDGYSNMATRQPTLTLNVASGVFAWGTPSIGSDSAIHLFDITTGQRICKVVSPATYSEINGNVYEVPVDSIGKGISILDNKISFHYSKGQQNGMAQMDFSSLRSRPLIDRTRILSPDLFLNISINSRRDLIYEAIHGEQLNILAPTGDDEFRGTGDVISKRFPILDSVKTWFAAFRIRWAEPDGEL